MLKDEIRKPYFIKLKEFLWEQGVKGLDEVPKTLKIYPARKWKLHRSAISPLTTLAAANIYAWSNLTPLGRVKVVIIGQDPYHGPNQAHGAHGSVHRLRQVSSPRALQVFVSLCRLARRSPRHCVMYVARTAPALLGWHLLQLLPRHARAWKHALT